MTHDDLRGMTVFMQKHKNIYYMDKLVVYPALRSESQAMKRLTREVFTEIHSARVHRDNGDADDMDRSDCDPFELSDQENTMDLQRTCAFCKVIM